LLGVEANINTVLAPGPGRYFPGVVSEESPGRKVAQINSPAELDQGRRPAAIMRARVLDSNQRPHKQEFHYKTQEHEWKTLYVSILFNKTML